MTMNALHSIMLCLDSPEGIALQVNIITLRQNYKNFEGKGATSTHLLYNTLIQMGVLT